MFTKNHIHFHNISSTNDFTLSLRDTSLFVEGLLVTTDYQEAGRGQVSKKWLSKKGLNLLLSVVIKPNIHIDHQFDISRVVSLAIKDFLNSLGLEVSIKWPNDILINQRKIAGVLIQNIVIDNVVIYSVIGIGLNVNQVQFPSFPIIATSLINELGRFQDCQKIRDDLLNFLSEKLLLYRKGKINNIEYNDALFLKGKEVLLAFKDKYLKCVIKNVNRDGCLEVSINNKIQKFFANEVRFVL